MLNYNKAEIAIVNLLLNHYKTYTVVMQAYPKPTKAEIQAAFGRFIPDVLAPNLKVLFCGINPSLYSAAVGHHFARPGNRFWPALHAAGFTERLLTPAEDCDLLKSGYGFTNLAPRATARADQLDVEELLLGHQQLSAKVQHYQPRFLAVLGVSAYRIAFNRPKAAIGGQLESLSGTRVWVLPNPSGLNAHYQLNDLARTYRDLRVTAEE